MAHTARVLSQPSPSSALGLAETMPLRYVSPKQDALKQNRMRHGPPPSCNNTFVHPGAHPPFVAELCKNSLLSTYDVLPPGS